MNIEVWNDGRNQVSGVATMLLLISSGIGLGLTLVMHTPVPVIVGIIVGLYLLFSIRVADQWEKVAVLRLGRYVGLRGPGAFFVVPIIDRLSRSVDQRVRVASV